MLNFRISLVLPVITAFDLEKCCHMGAEENASNFQEGQLPRVKQKLSDLLYLFIQMYKLNVSSRGMSEETKRSKE